MFTKSVKEGEREFYYLRRIENNFKNVSCIFDSLNCCQADREKTT